MLLLFFQSVNQKLLLRLNKGLAERSWFQSYSSSASLSIRMSLPLPKSKLRSQAKREEELKCKMPSTNAKYQKRNKKWKAFVSSEEIESHKILEARDTPSREQHQILFCSPIWQRKNLFSDIFSFEFKLSLCFAFFSLLLRFISLLHSQVFQWICQHHTRIHEPC